MKNQSKIIKILFYVANVLFDVGKRGECTGTFLGTYRLEKRSKSHGVSDKSITIEIPIQMHTLQYLQNRRLARRLRSAARRLIQGKLKLDDNV